MRLVRLVLSGGLFGTFRKISGQPFLSWRLSGPVAEELLIAPQDLRTTDPTLANDFYAGHFVFAGKAVNCGALSPFEIDAPSAMWREKLVEFGWLRHLRSAETEIARTQARIHLDDFITMEAKPNSDAWSVDLTAKRVIAWLCHSPLLLEGCDHHFYRRFMRSLSRQVRFLRLTGNDAPDGLPRLNAAIALSYASVCIGGHDTFLKNANKRLNRELTRQFLADGGHFSRNPGAIISTLAYLLPLRQAIITRNFVPDDSISNTIDRLMPMLRFFRMGDGNFAHFNGMGDTPSDLVATVLAYDDTGGMPVSNASHSGYQRVDAGTSILVMDAGKLPPRAVSAETHAGCLSFELSCGRDRLIINCGKPGPQLSHNDNSTWQKLAKTTAAHSTLSINHESSCRFVDYERYGEVLNSPVISGPDKVSCKRTMEDGITKLEASHNGYVPPFGLEHHRTLSINHNGTEVSGVDQIMTAKGSSPSPGNKATFQIRFHLHPSVQVDQISSKSVELRTASGNNWVFSTEDVKAKVDQSVALADVYHSRQTNQIVLEGVVGKSPKVEWSLQKID